MKSVNKENIAEKPETPISKVLLSEKKSEMKTN